MAVNTRNRQDTTYLNYITRIINDNGVYDSVPLYQYKDQYDKLMMFNPTLLFYPNSQKTNTLYSILPTTSSQFTMSRSSIGTYFNKSGALVTASNNAPRFEWDPITKEYKGLTIESAYTNLVSDNNNSLQIGVDGSSIYSPPIKLNNEFGPGVNGFYMYHPSGSFLSALYSIGNTQFSIPSGSSIHYTCIIKNPSSNDFGINIASIGQVYFRFSTLESRPTDISNTNIRNHSIIKVGDNTYKLSVNMYSPNGVSFFQNRQGLILDYSSNNSSTVDGNFIMGLPTLVTSQTPIASTAISALPNIISFIPTSGSSVTKQIDMCNSPLLNYNTTQWSISFEIEYLSDYVGDTGDVNGFSNTTYIWYFRRYLNAQVNFWNQFSQQNLGMLYFTPNTVKKFRGIMTFNGSVINTYVNGTKIGTNITPTNVTPFLNFMNNSNSRISFSKANLMGYVESAHVAKYLAVYTYTLSDEQAINLTRF